VQLTLSGAADRCSPQQALAMGGSSLQHATPTGELLAEPCILKAPAIEQAVDLSANKAKRGMAAACYVAIAWP